MQGLAEQMAKRFGAKEVVDGMMAGLEKDLFYIHVQADGDTPFHKVLPSAFLLLESFEPLSALG